MSDAVWSNRRSDIERVMEDHPFVRVSIDQVYAQKHDFDVAFISRDVTGISTKHQVEPSTQRFYDALTGARSLTWVHVHSAGADRFVYQELIEKGVQVTVSPGANASSVAQTALAGILSIAREFPAYMKNQRAHHWQAVPQRGVPPDLEGQTAVIVGWGAVGQRIGKVLHALDVRVIVVRQTASPVEIAQQVVGYTDFETVLPQADWLILACPLSKETTKLVSREALAEIKRDSVVVNVSRGPVVDEEALIERLQDGHLRGVHLDVFTTEPLPESSPLWDIPNVIVTPHSGGLAQGVYGRTEQMFLDNLQRFVNQESLKHSANP